MGLPATPFTFIRPLEGFLWSPHPQFRPIEQQSQLPTEHSCSASVHKDFPTEVKGARAGAEISALSGGREAQGEIAMDRDKLHELAKRIPAPEMFGSTALLSFLCGSKPSDQLQNAL